MNDADKSRLRRLLASLDEAALVALANKGLVRRAGKDLEAGGISHEEQQTDLIVYGPGWTVRMPPTGPADAEDDTRATGVTRQVLTATLYLQNNWVNAQAQPEVAPACEGVTLRQRLTAITPEQLQRWAGKRAVNSALAYLKGGEVVVECGVGVTVRFETHEVEVRLLEGEFTKRAAALLDRAVTTAPKAVRREWIAAAVLALWRDSAQDVEAILQTAHARPAQSMTGRGELLASAVRTLETLAATGVAHPSSSAIEQFFTLSVSARAGDLPRLSRILRTIADELELILSRNAKGDTDRLLHLVAQAHAMAEAIRRAGQSAPFSLTGRHRSEYGGRGDLMLTGIGAYPWKTASGYEGLTVMFWDAAERTIRTWTDSRPVGSPDRFSPTSAYTNGVVWQTAPPVELCRSCFTLQGANWNDLGRLSSTAQAVGPRQATHLRNVDFGPVGFNSWTKLADYTRSIYPLGLRDGDPSIRVVVLTPASWGERVFDEAQQQFVWDLIDSDQGVVCLTLPWTQMNEAMVDFLEAVKPEREKLAAVVVRIAFTSRGVRLEPLSLLTDGADAVLNPAFDAHRIRSQQSTLLVRLREKFRRRQVSAVLESETDEFEHLASLVGLPAQFSRLMADTGSALLAIGESGTRSANQHALNRLRANANLLERLGVTELSAALRQCGPEILTPENFLHAQYIQVLHAQAARMSIAFGTD